VLGAFFEVVLIRPVGIRKSVGQMLS